MSSLLIAGADPSEPDGDGWAPLQHEPLPQFAPVGPSSRREGSQHAAAEGHADVVAVLVGHGADVHVAGPNDRTALDFAESAFAKRIKAAEEKARSRARKAGEDEATDEPEPEGSEDAAEEEESSGEAEAEAEPEPEPEAEEPAATEDPGSVMPSHERCCKPITAVVLLFV